MTKHLFPVVDVETSGLDAGKDFLLEIAVILIDEDLEEHGRYSEVVHYPQSILADIYEMTDPFVQRMHTDNGLWEEAGKPGLYLEEIDEQLSTWLKMHVAELEATSGEEVQLRTVGNSLRLDLNFINECLPSTYAVLGYRSIDMSAVAKFLGVWAHHEDYIKVPSIEHRAMADNEMCIEQMRHHIQILKGL